MARLLHHRSRFVCHSRREFEALLRVCATASVILAALCIPAVAMKSSAQTVCVSSLKVVGQLVYPPIAKAAHVSGKVVMLLSFAHDGAVAKVKVLYGPEMLRASSVSFAKSFQADASTGSRECPYSVNYALGYEGKGCEVQAKLDDSSTSHTFVCVESLILSDPAVTITRRRRRFLIL
jgi:hypothetical protein